MENSSDEVTLYVGPTLHQAIAEAGGHIGNKDVVPFMHMVLAYPTALRTMKSNDPYRLRLTFSRPM